MAKGFFRERKHYTLQEIADILYENREKDTEETKRLVGILKKYGVVKTVKREKPEFEANSGNNGPFPGACRSEESLSIQCFPDNGKFFGPARNRGANRLFARKNRIPIRNAGSGRDCGRFTSNEPAQTRTRFPGMLLRGHTIRVPKSNGTGTTRKRALGSLPVSGDVTH